MREIVPAKKGYEEGLQAGKQVAGTWKPSRLTLPEKWREATIEAPNGTGVGSENLDRVLGDLEKWSREDMLNYAADLHRRSLDAFPDVRKFPEIEGRDQYENEYPRGYAEGAGIDIREVHLEKYWKDMYFFALGGGRLSPYNCS